MYSIIFSPLHSVVVFVVISVVVVNTSRGPFPPPGLGYFSPWRVLVSSS